MKTRTHRTLKDILAGPGFWGLGITAAVLLAATAPKASPKMDDGQRLTSLVDTFVDEYTAAFPTEATALGLHAHDADLEDLSDVGLGRTLAWAKSWEARFAALSADQLPAPQRFDLELVRYELGKQIFALTEMRDPYRRPGVYLSLAAHSINLLIKRDFAPAETRLRAVLSRQAKIVNLLKVAEHNLNQMAQVWIDITLSDLDATIDFFARDVPQAFAQVQNLALQTELQSSRHSTVAALRRFGEFLRQSRPRATASYALGPTLLQKRLWADELIDEPLDSLQRRSQAELARLQAEFRAVAQKIDAHKPASVIQLEMQKDHPGPTDIISETTARLQTQQRFLIDKALITLPSKHLPEVKETPPFMRATSLASMDAAGPFESVHTAYYYVTLPEPTWHAEQTEDFLRGAYNRPLIDVVNIHEAFPGHYVQDLWRADLSKARKVFTANSNLEGWAHYSEQMMLDENYGAGDPRLRLAQLQDALLRAARFVVALRMHTQGMTVEQATEFFNREGFQTRKVSEMEALRGTQDPMYLVYTYGKLEIFKLRQEIKARQGNAFSLRRFHDELLGYGSAPFKLIRQAMLNHP